MLAEDIQVGDHLWATAGGWKKVKSVLRLAPITIRERPLPGKVQVHLEDGSWLTLNWHASVHTATEYSTDA